MTGYGTAAAPLAEGQVIIELKAVNHRFLDIRVRAPTELSDHSAALEQIIRSRVLRGRIEATVKLEGMNCQPRLDIERAASAYAQLCAVRDRVRPEEPLPLTILNCVPDLFTRIQDFDPVAASNAVETACTQACEELSTMRQREGAALKRELTRLIEEIRAHEAKIRGQVPQILNRYRNRLQERVRTWLPELDIKLDPGRLEQELALFADRSDVAEELQRLHSHGEQFLELIETESAPVGRKLEFLTQEMAREANTLGSKCPDTLITPSVIAIKASVERIREQVQNIL